MSLLVVIDANNQLHRLYHAMGAYDAAQAWMRHLDAFCYDLAKGDRSRVYVAFDGDRGTAWRRELVPAYKGNRDDKKSDLIELLSGAVMASTEAGFETFNVPEAEADDVVAAIVTRHSSEKAIVVSSDKDLHQLLECGRVNQLRKYSVSKGSVVGRVWYTADNFIEEYGVKPLQWPTWKAIAGDSSDNMSGVPRCGPVCASAVLKLFPTLLAVAEAQQFLLPCKAHERKAIVAALTSGDLAKWETIATLRRDCLDLALAEGGA